MKLSNGEKFPGTRDGISQITATMSSGSVTLKALAGSKNGTAVAIPDAYLDTSGIITFYQLIDQWYEITLTGDAEAWLT